MKQSFVLFGLIAAMMGYSSDMPAADGTTTINVQYRTKAIRIRPSYLDGGTRVNIGMVLETNGNVSEKLRTTGPRPQRTAKVRSLGGSDGSVAFRLSMKTPSSAR